MDIWSATGFSSAHVESVARPHIIPIHSTHHSDRIDWYVYIWKYIQGVFFNWYIPPLKVLSTKNVDSPNLGFTYFNFLGGYQLKLEQIAIERSASKS